MKDVIIRMTNQRYISIKNVKTGFWDETSMPQWVKLNTDNGWSIINTANICSIERFDKIKEKKWYEFWK